MSSAKAGEAGGPVGRLDAQGAGRSVQRRRDRDHHHHPGPRAEDPARRRLAALAPLLPAFVSYVLSFIYLGIYWNNHHHLLQAATHVNGVVLWANLHLLFWLSLIPFVTGWMGENEFARIPVAVYGADLLMAALAYYLLERALIAAQGKSRGSRWRSAAETKGWISVAFYVAGILAASFWTQWIALGLYVAVSLMWLIPDRRIERVLGKE